MIYTYQIMQRLQTPSRSIQIRTMLASSTVVSRNDFLTRSGIPSRRLFIINRRTSGLFSSRLSRFHCVSRLSDKAVMPKRPLIQVDCTTSNWYTKAPTLAQHSCYLLLASTSFSPALLACRCLFNSICSCLILSCSSTPVFVFSCSRLNSTFVMNKLTTISSAAKAT